MKSNEDCEIRLLEFFAQNGQDFYKSEVLMLYLSNSNNLRQNDTYLNLFVSQTYTYVIYIYKGFKYRYYQKQRIKINIIILTKYTKKKFISIIIKMPAIELSGH